MAETRESVFTDELQACFTDLKKHSMSYKLGHTQQPVGDEIQNPLHKQFSLILTKIEDILGKQAKESEDYIQTICMKASIIYEKAKILLSENLLSESKEVLEDGLRLILGYFDTPKVAFLYMRIVNHLTYVLSRLGELERAKELLLKAIEDGDRCKPHVFSTDDLFLKNKKDEKLSEIKLNRLTLNNMQMLAWIYGKLGNTEKHLQVQHDILQKQLDLAEGDILKWAESCFRLAGMFVANNDWENARYHLTAAESVLNPLEISIIPNPELYAVQGDLARSWIYYGLQLFETSRKVKSESSIQQESLTSKSLSKESVKNTENKPCLIFQGLPVELPISLPIKKIENIQEAKLLFTAIQKWVKRARLYFTLRDYPLQYVNLCLDLSELYRFLALYEEDIDSQYAVQKKRYDALETLSTIVKEVRPNCYVAVNVELTKEIVEVQMEMMNLNLKKLYMPTEVLRTNVTEDLLRRQISAFSCFHNKLENVTSTLDTSSLETKSEQKDEIAEEIPTKDDSVKELNI